MSESRSHEEQILRELKTTFPLRQMLTHGKFWKNLIRKPLFKLIILIFVWFSYVYYETQDHAIGLVLIVMVMLLLLYVFFALRIYQEAIFIEILDLALKQKEDRP